MPRIKRKVNGDFVVRTFDNNDAVVEVVSRKFAEPTMGAVSANAVTFSPPGSTSSTAFSEIVVADSDTLSFNSGTGTVDKPFSISVWVNLDTLANTSTGTKRTILQKGPGDGDAVAELEWRVSTFSGQPALTIYGPTNESLGGGDFAFISTGAGAALSANTWAHIVFTYDGRGNATAANGMEVYKNGSKVGSPSRLTQARNNGDAFAGMKNQSGALVIGSSKGGSEAAGGHPWDGEIADIIIFNKTLTSSEVTSLYGGGKVIDPLTVFPESDIISWWKMGDTGDSASGSGAIKDSVGSNNGTPANITIGAASATLNSGKFASSPRQLEAPLPFVFGVLGKPSLRHAPQVP